MVLKLSICTSALPWRQQSDWGLRVSQNAHFLLMTHTKQLLLVTFSDNTARIGASFRTDAHTHTHTHTAAAEGQTDVEVEIVI